MKFKWLNRLSPGRLLVLGFLSLILVGTVLLLLPISANPGVTIGPVDALFTSTSAVCITGLIAIDTSDHFSVFGRTVVALLMQAGGLGITTMGVMFIWLTGKPITLRERVLVREALNLGSLSGIVRLIRSILVLTLTFELVGMVLSLLVFMQDFPFLKALGISAFHSIAAFNNAGFDILGGYQNLIPYQSNVLLNLTTCGLIIFGGIGFYVIREIWEKRSFKKLSMNSKIVLSTSAFLLIAGTLFLKATQQISWLGAFFQSTSARTAGFSSYSIGNFTVAGQFMLIILMFIGASPGSTGGGVKTTTAFTLFRSLLAYSTNRECTAFKRKIPTESIHKAFTIVLLAIALICVNTLLIALIEPGLTFMQVLFEVTSAFGTVGLSTGITPDLSAASKLILCLTMFTGRLGPLTMACMWIYNPKSTISHPEEKVTIG